jgi:hypothetical protein
LPSFGIGRARRRSRPERRRRRCPSKPCSWSAATATRW